MKKIIAECLPLLLLCGMGEIAAGSVLGGMGSLLHSMDGLIVLVPGIIGLRGNISGSLGSRLGSAMHLGLITSENVLNDELHENIRASITLSVLMAGLIAILAYATCRILGLPSLSPLRLLAIALLTGCASGVLQALVTVGIIALAFRREYDPDNITGPILATVGDVITLLCLAGSAMLVGSL